MSSSHGRWFITKRIQTGASGNLEEACTSDPFNGGLSCLGNGDISKVHFTGKERDTESGLDYFGARYYGSSMGRWTSPDWSSIPQPIPYADLNNPRSLNLYAYVSNNPLSKKDPNGHTDPCGNDPNCVTVTTTEPERIELQATQIGQWVEHHFFPQSLFKNGSDFARQSFSRWVTNPFNNLGKHKGFSCPHRCYNAKVKEIIEKVTEKYGKPISEWGKDEVHEAATEIRAEAAKTGSEINELISDIEQGNPGATQTI
jgi:RHS repeat-associated protein